MEIRDDCAFVVIEWNRYLLEITNGEFYAGHRMTDKTGYDFNVDLTLPRDYFLSHTVDDFYEEIASCQRMRATWADRKTEVIALESQLKALGWIPRDPEEKISVIVTVRGRNYTISQEPDGSFLVVHGADPEDRTDCPVLLRLPKDYMQNHTGIMLYNRISEWGKSISKECPITDEMWAIYFACRNMGWPIQWEHIR